MFNHIQKKKKLLPTLCCAGLLGLTGCATNSTSGVDPYEDVNRGVFEFNEGLDEYLGEPISTAYDWITPEFVQTGIGNFFDNLKDINVALNNTLQGKYQKGGEDVGRFLLNSTVGLGGLFDIATKVGLKKHDEDFAQTLAVWGVPQGAYLVVPVLGPMTSRGVPGVVFDTAANPATYVGVPIRTLEMINLRANADAQLKMIDEAALDPYVFTREAFLQSRQHLITDGASEDEDDLDIDDLLEDEELIEVEAKGFQKATNSLNKTETAFEKTSRSFDEISHKVEQLEHSKKKYRR